jgi:DNA-directed RNA polymerase subunit omega
MPELEDGSFLPEALALEKEVKGMSYIVPNEALMAHVDSKYRLIIIAAKRAKQLNRGSRPLLNPKNRKPTYIALEEIAAGKIAYEAELFGAVEKELLPEEAKPTWFRSLTAEEVLAEELAHEEDVFEEEAEEGEPIEEELSEIEEIGAEEEKEV